NPSRNSATLLAGPPGRPSTRSSTSVSENSTPATVHNESSVTERLAAAGCLAPSSLFPQYLTSARFEFATAQTIPNRSVSSRPQILTYRTAVNMLSVSSPSQRLDEKQRFAVFDGLAVLGHDPRDAATKLG